MLAAIWLDGAALREFGTGWVQLLAGPTDPFGRAHRLLDGARNFIGHAGFSTTVAVVACKVAAANMLPYAGSNGAQAIQGLFTAASPHGQYGTWQRRITNLLGWCTLLFCGSWLLALASWSLG